MKRYYYQSLFAALLVCAFAIPASAFTNPGFETGDFTGWSTMGAASIQTNAFGIDPAGTYMALIESGNDEGGPIAASGVDVADFIGADLDEILNFAYGTTEEYVGSASALQQSFSAGVGDSVFFGWDFLTNELDVDVDEFNDLAVAVLTGPDSSTTFLASAAGSVLYDSDTPYQRETDIFFFESFLTQAGDYTLSVAVFNMGDDSVSSGLLVENFGIDRVGGAPVPEPSTWVLFALGGLGLLGYRRLRA